jgi:diadenosine tetraphosphate (Ap4A) HIT family hydrolase
VKLNLEIHGNTLPHLHVHVFPRYIGDRFERGPIDPSQVSEPVYTGNGFAEMRHHILRALESEVT